MARIRIALGTGRIRRVLLALCLASLLGPAAAAGPDEFAIDRALRRVLRPTLELSERLAAAELVLEGRELADGETLLRAGASLLAKAPELGGWLLLAGCEAAWPDTGLREETIATIDGLLASNEAPLADRAAWAAAGTLVGRRPAPVADDLLAVWPPSPFVEAVLRRDGVTIGDDDESAGTRGRLAAVLPALRALDDAESDDPERMRHGLDALLELGDAAMPVLVAEARAAALRAPKGRVPRQTRAVLALGLLGRREATPVLVDCLDAPNGWVQAAAATAIGDLGDPAAAVALCHKITYRGDVLRPRDQWDFPGERETPIAREDWPKIEYFAVDCLVADALLRLGVPGAAGWLIKNKLDPAKANFRIRVLQEAVDALRRSVPDAPTDAYVVDQGVPHRRRAFESLLAWWEANAFDAVVEGARFNGETTGFRREARRMVERLRGRSIMELQISQETCAIIGPPVTPVLLETLGATSSRVLRTEIARALGVVRDPRAVDALLALVRDRAAFLRAVAAESLGSYLGRDPRVEPVLVELLDDREAAPRVAALSALVTARPSATLAETLAARTPDTYRERFGADDRDYRMAWTTAMLVVAGEERHWPTVKAWLEDDERYVRRASWDLLRRALGLPYSLYDGNVDPDSPAWRPLDETRVRAALQARRGAR